MEKSITVWCIEAPQSNFLKEIVTHTSGQRLLFTDNWYDTPMTFGMKEQAKRFKKDNNLDWLNITEHLIMN